MVLRDNPALKVEIIGHANPSSNADYDWEISTMRALAVAKELATFGVDAGRITAAGQGGNHPLVPATNSQAQMLNGRTLILIPMDYSSILRSLE